MRKNKGELLNTGPGNDVQNLVLSYESIVCRVEGLSNYSSYPLTDTLTRTHCSSFSKSVRFYCDLLKANVL